MVKSSKKYKKNALQKNQVVKMMENNNIMPQQKNGIHLGKVGKRWNPKLDEASRIKIKRLLEEFRASQNDVYTFDPTLNREERGAVHKLCKKMGFRSKSYGKGDQRCLSVFYKKKKKVNRYQKKKYNILDKGKVESMMEKEHIMHIKFSKESTGVLQDLFICHPPCDFELGNKAVGKCSVPTDKSLRKKDEMFCKPLISKVEITKKVNALASGIQMAEVRGRLPIASFRESITSTIESHQVTLISGETGCGKTTQVPQYILDRMWSKGETCKIVCTQPRRISATSVAERISYERGEKLGQTVGYKIRLDSTGGRNSSIVFCTNGILLRLLVSQGICYSLTDSLNTSAKGTISGITHIVMDEIHERDRYSDIMLAILRDMLALHPNLRLILMSATLDSERFSQYFGGCPIIHVPSFTYPVETYFLEDVLGMLRSGQEESKLSQGYKCALDDAITLACTDDEFDPLIDLVSSAGSPQFFNYQHSSTGVTPLMVFAGKGRLGEVCMLLTFGANFNLRAKDGTTALDCAERENHGKVAELIRQYAENTISSSKEDQEMLDKYLATVNHDLVDIGLLQNLISKICSDTVAGAILVFLPGWHEINRIRERLQSLPFFSDLSKFLILPLHSMVPSVEQKKVFNLPPRGCRKIILSTNIAETAVTIEDVVYVINSGRVKEKSYDPYKNISTFQSSWVSKANAKQREGRAGRCQPGICYHLYSKLRAVSLPDFQVPEIKRMPIEDICLQVKLLDSNCEIETFLKKLLDVPVFETMRNAIATLQNIGALTSDGKLSSLGEKLGLLPVQPSTGKMLFLSILLSCLGPALTLACASDFKDPFTFAMFPDEKQKASAAKSELASLYGGSSDQLAVVAAFDGWKNAISRREESKFCSRYFISSTTMNMLSSMRMQLQSELSRSGFFPKDVSTCSLNAKDPGILHAVLVAGLYPMVGRLNWLHSSGKKVIVETQNGDKAFLHSQSSNSKIEFNKADGCPLVVFDEMIRGDFGLQIRNSTLLAPLPLLLLSSEIAVAPAKHDDDGSLRKDEDASEVDGVENKIMASPDNSVVIVVDRWLSFETTAIEVAQIYCLRERLSAAILFRVTNPREVLPPRLGASVFAIACILSFDGLVGLSKTSKGSAIKTNTSKSRVMGRSLCRFLKTLNMHQTQTSPSESQELGSLKGSGSS